jgi:hypothetical protein
VEEVMLREQTLLTPDVVPDLGTRFIFPFFLDEIGRDASFNLQMTNAAVFKCDIRDEHGQVNIDALQGRNSFVVTMPAQANSSAQYLGYLFVSLGGYNLTVLLRTTNNLAVHRSNIVFKLDPKEREHLLDELVNRRLAVAKQALDAQAADLNEKAQELAMREIGHLAMQDPKSHWIREKKQFTTEAGSQFSLLLDEVRTYGPFHLFVFEVENQGGQTLTIKDAGLVIKGKKNLPDSPVPTAQTLPKDVAAGKSARGVVVTRTDAVMTDKVALQVLVDNGTYQVVWD